MSDETTPTHPEITPPNGAESPSPIQPRRKASSWASATRSGFTSNNVALPDESASSYRALYRSYVMHFRPQNIIESDLVSVMVLCRWRLRRTVTIETNHLALEIDSRRNDVKRYVDNPTPDKLMAWTFARLSGGHALPHITRYEATLHRTYNNALKQLEALREKPTGQISTRTQASKNSIEPNPQS